MNKHLCGKILLPEKLGEFFLQFNIEMKSRELIADREVYLQSDQVSMQRRGKGKAPPGRGPGSGMSFKRREGEH